MSEIKTIGLLLASITLLFFTLNFLFVNPKNNEIVTLGDKDVIETRKDPLFLPFKQELEEFPPPEQFQSVDFEITGKVQGVYFRKHTQEKGKALGLSGWVMNTVSGSVRGTMQGPAEKIESMKEWFCKVGSPKSRIDQCVFTNERVVNGLEYKGFSVLK